jgi:hypothetical protein
MRTILSKIALCFLLAALALGCRSRDPEPKQFDTCGCIENSQIRIKTWNSYLDRYLELSDTIYGKDWHMGITWRLALIFETDSCHPDVSNQWQIADHHEVLNGTSTSLSFSEMKVYQSFPISLTKELPSDLSEECGTNNRKLLQRTLYVDHYKNSPLVGKYIGTLSGDTLIENYEIEVVATDFDWPDYDSNDFHYYLKNGLPGFITYDVGFPHASFLQQFSFLEDFKKRRTFPKDKYGEDVKYRVWRPQNDVNHLTNICNYQNDTLRLKFSLEHRAGNGSTRTKHLNYVGKKTNQ